MRVALVEAGSRFPLADVGVRIQPLRPDPVLIRWMLDVRLRPEAGGIRFPQAPITLEPGETRIVDWTLDGAVLVRGVVVDEHGEPVVGAPVAAITVRGAPPPSPGAGVIHMPGALPDFAARDETDAEGRFELTGLHPGRWAVGVVRARYPPDLEVSATGALVEVPEGVSEVETRVTVFRELSIRGVVRGPDGDPPGEVHVTADSVVGGAFADATVDGEGRFALAPLAPGLHRLWAWAPGRLLFSPPLEVEAGALDVLLQARVAGALRGRIFQADGAPAPRVRVRLVPNGNGIDDLPLQTPGGQLDISPLAPGIYDLVLSSPAGDALALIGQIVTENRTSELDDLYLEPAARLFLAAGEHRSKVRATLRSAGATFPVDLWPGQTTAVTLPPGSWELEWPPPRGGGGGPLSPARPPRRRGAAGGTRRPRRPRPHGAGR